MIRRLRDPIVYTVQYQHRNWADHQERIGELVQIVAELDPTSAADLSAGDGAVLDSLDCPKVYGDVVEVDGWLCGPVEDTVAMLEPVDLFVSSETLEHLDNPLRHLADVRSKASRLLLSTPVHAGGVDENPEHVWQWDVTDVDQLLSATGWTVVDYLDLDYRPAGGYLTGVWVCT